MWFIFFTVRELYFFPYVTESKAAVWEYFTKNSDLISAKCKKCSKNLKLSGRSTKGLHVHLKSMHSIIPSATTEDKIQDVKDPDDPGLGSHVQPDLQPTKKRKVKL